jgi:hypothetical protein
MLLIDAPGSRPVGLQILAIGALVATTAVLARVAFGRIASAGAGR